MKTLQLPRQLREGALEPSVAVDRAGGMIVDVRGGTVCRPGHRTQFVLRQVFMGVKPFVKLAKPRDLAVHSLPADLAEFYRTNEGLGVESMESDLRFLRLNELAEQYRVTAEDLSRFGKEFKRGAWSSFSAICVAVDLEPSLICYVLKCPAAKAGSIMAFGQTVGGPGGNPDNALDNSVVLASDFRSWLARLEEDGWQEFGLDSDANGIPEEKQEDRIGLFSSLNPLSEWASF